VDGLSGDALSQVVLWLKKQPNRRDFVFRETYLLE